VVHQQMGQLGNRKNEDEIEKQFDKGDLAMRVRAAGTQETVARMGSGSRRGIGRHGGDGGY
jgi:hypothetical protein